MRSSPCILCKPLTTTNSGICPITMPRTRTANRINVETVRSSVKFNLFNGICLYVCKRNWTGWQPSNDEEASTRNSQVGELVKITIPFCPYRSHLGVLFFVGHDRPWLGRNLICAFLDNNNPHLLGLNQKGGNTDANFSHLFSSKRDKANN